MKLFWSPGACSMGIHFLLEEIGAPYESARVVLARGEHHTETYKAINPKVMVPVLQRDDGSFLTEYPAIAFWLARKFPDAALWPRDLDDQARVLEVMDYVVSTVHMRGFTRIFRPANFAAEESQHDAVKAIGLEMVQKGYAILDAAVGSRDYVIGPLSIADSALFYVEFWGAKRLGLALPANLAGHLDRMLARPAVQRMLAEEGLS